VPGESRRSAVSLEDSRERYRLRPAVHKVADFWLELYVLPLQNRPVLGV
jgi:hypothetical protein